MKSIQMTLSAVTKNLCHSSVMRKCTSLRIACTSHTVSRSIAVMTEDILKQLLLRIKSSDFYALQIDESTDEVGFAQLLARYFYDGIFQRRTMQTTGFAIHSLPPHSTPARF